MSEIIINSEPALQAAIGELRDLWGRNKYVRMVLRSRKRSLDQNALAAVWYEQMAREDRQHDALGHKCYCKLHHGVPILRAEDAEYRTFYDGAIKGLSYEQKLVAMKFLPVTSLMTAEQLSKYLEAVQSDYASRGVHVQFPVGRKAA
ncbi:hypothetical protein [Xanthomonas sp. SHU 199]|uniref:hypothetical protein n=1 Tax=Xanthomonas sp. SHU 199 TaxID=1591174 RepID=UPI00035C3AC1|nr:hypothetical protein [Xanthomonas sp. SHU 199]